MIGPEQLTYARCEAYRRDHGLPWFDEPWDLNLLIVRSGIVGEWDDWWVVCALDEAGREVVQHGRCTGDAWQGEWVSPSHPEGAVYVLDQHVPQGLERGAHRGRPALRQVRPFRCVRWPPGSVPTIADLEARALTHSFTAIRGTHLHNRASGIAPARPRPDDSEGCTVSLYYHQHAALMALVDQQRRARGTSLVSPTFLRASALT